MVKVNYLRNITRMIAFALIMLMVSVLLANPTYASSNWGASKYVAVVDDYDSPNMGSIYPADYPNQTFNVMAPATLSKASLANYDTLFLWAFNPGLLNASQKTDINNWVYDGGKLIIWDSEEPYYSPGSRWDYTWLAYPFSTSVPGAQGAYGGGFGIIENNDLSSNITSSLFYINTSIINTQTDAIGDANIFTSYSSNWCVDMRATNVLNVEGPVHLYARYGNGLMIYSGVDWDYAGYSGMPSDWSTASAGQWIKKIFKQELDVSGGLPCGVIQPPSGTPTLQVTKTSDRTSYNINDTITFNIIVANIGTATANGVNLTDIAPTEITITGNSTFSLGDMATGASLSRTVTAIASTNGTVNNIATATGTDSQNNLIAGSGNVTFTILGQTVPPTPGPLANINVHPNPVSLFVGESEQFNATGTDANGKSVSFTSTWSSSNNAIGTINTAGLFSAISAGTTIVTASSGGITGTATVNVSSRSALVITASQTTITENTPTYVTFTVTSNGLPVVNALVSLTGAETGSGNTDINGQVTLLVNAAMGTITATASKSGYNSATMTLIVVTAPVLVVSANDSSVIVNTPTYVSFTVASKTAGGAPVNGALVSLTGAATGSGTTDINGRVTLLINAAFGTITATASKTSYNSGTLTIPAIYQPTLTLQANPGSVVVNNPTYVLYTASVNGTPVSGALVSLTGAATGSGTTDTFGKVHILVNAGMGTITATASKTDYISGTLTTTVTSAMTLTVTANPNVVKVNTPTNVVFTITDSGQPVSGALVSLSGGQTGSGNTDTNGHVTILINAGLGTITATASKTGYTSGTTTLTTTSSDILTIAANPSTLVENTPISVVLTVTSAGQPVSGALVSLTGTASGSGMTDMNGNVSIFVMPGLGTITATASKSNYDSGTLTITVSSPPTLTISANPEEVVVGTPTYVEFTVTSNGQPVSGALLGVSGAGTGAGTTNTNGKVSILINAALGTLTVTATKTSYNMGVLTLTATQPLTMTITANPSSVASGNPTYVTFNVTANGRPVSGAIVDISGTATGTGTTDTRGLVTLLMNPGLGTVTATASKTSYNSATTTISVTGQTTLTISASRENVTANNPTYVTFTVTDTTTGLPVSGALVDVTGAGIGTGTTNTNGQVIILINAALGTITATASKTGYTAGTTTLTVGAPITLTIEANRDGVVANRPTYVTFTVTANDHPVRGVFVDITGAGIGHGTTNTNGQVTILINAALGTITVTASRAGFGSGTTTIAATGTPGLTITADTDSVIVNNPRSITFTVTENGRSVSGALVTLSGAAYGHGTTNTNGQVIILVNPVYGVITATASKAGSISGTMTLPTSSGGAGQQLEVEASPTNVTANSPTSITFTVTANSTPVRDAIVFLTDAGSGIGTTDSNGRVTILVSAAYGTITSTASKTGFRSGTLTIPVEGGVAPTPIPTPVPSVTPGPGVTVTPTPIPTPAPTPVPPVIIGTQSSGVVTRTMPASISADTMFSITLTPAPVSNFDSPGYQVIETLPQGFTYINTTAIGASVRDNTLTFTQIGSTTISYNVMSPSNNGSYTFSGTFKDESSNMGIVGGTSTISIGAVVSGPMRYDANGDGKIDRNEAVQAVIDYFSGIITRQDAVEVVIRYFSG